MRSVYENATENLLPVIRFEISNELKNKYKMQEQEIAERLGITQAAVSKYINHKSKRISAMAKKLAARIGANKSLVDAYIKDLLEEHTNSSKFCELCQNLGSFSCALAKLRANAML
ncbi:MAG: hypothetical protein QXR85_01890 [Candidatus Micrarchaeaceae archaeon]